jgi:hypothetical protein
VALTALKGDQTTSELLLASKSIPPW